MRQAAAPSSVEGALDGQFQRTWEFLAGIGRNGRTGGYRRFAWTAVDLELRAWFAEQASQRGMDYHCDRNGNQWAWWGAPATGALVTGSHLDSVPDGGVYDGPLGVVSGFLAVDLLRARGVEPGRPIAVTNFCDEEGARFGVACIGSQLLTGVLDPDRARGLRDVDGHTLAESMQRAGADPSTMGRDDEALSWIGDFVELHVEQGQRLVHLGAAVGVATAIWPHGRWRFRFEGEANHAGATRLVDRRDPMLPFASTVLAARALAEQAGAVATVGKVHVVPNGTNAIPSRVDAWLDSRAPDETTVADLVAAITTTAQRAASSADTTVEVTRESYSPVVDFDARLRNRIHEVLGGVPELPTGAGHDAGILSARVPTAMLFVRNPTGVSHSPAEYASAVDCVAGVRALAAVLEDLSCR
ncbi:N-carbamoyl-L-amino-acid hydrolase [Modestobacter sp. DSM 44400]|nr:N-carbamoyl-L-amino-acid hydrolase [Modestobacter sp. DSM 44400]